MDYQKRYYAGKDSYHDLDIAMSLCEVFTDPTAVDVFKTLIEKKQPETMTELTRQELIKKYTNGKLFLGKFYFPFEPNQPEKMKQTMTLDLNVLDLCTIDQLQEVEKIINNIKAKKTTESTKAEAEHKLRVKEEKKRNLDNKYKAFDAIRLRIVEQERFLEQQRNLLEKTGMEYTKIKNAYNEEYRIANK